MVTREQVRQGMLKYIDSEIVSKIGGLTKWGVAFGAVALVDSYLGKIDVLKKIGLMTEDGMIDIDTAYTKALDIARSKGSVTEHFPIIGDITFSERDIAALYEAIVH